MPRQLRGLLEGSPERWWCETNLIRDRQATSDADISRETMALAAPDRVGEIGGRPLNLAEIKVVSATRTAGSEPLGLRYNRNGYATSS